MAEKKPMSFTFTEYISANRKIINFITTYVFIPKSWYLQFKFQDCKMNYQFDLFQLNIGTASSYALQVHVLCYISISVQGSDAIELRHKTWSLCHRYNCVDTRWLTPIEIGQFYCQETHRRLTLLLIPCFFFTIASTELGGEVAPYPPLGLAQRGGCGNGHYR